MLNLPHLTQKVMQSSTVYIAPAVRYLIQDRTVNTHSKNSEFIDRYGAEFGADQLLGGGVHPFDSEESAQAYLEKQLHAQDWARVVPMPQADVLLYRADSYVKDSGALLGFFLEKDQAENVLRGMEPVDFAEGNFGQITVFAVSPQALDGIDLRDWKAVISEEYKLWTGGSHLETLYYK